MQVENHKEEVPFAHYCQLFEAGDAGEMAGRTGAGFDGKAFSVILLGTEYIITHPKYSISPQATLPMQTFLLRYLLEGKKCPPSTEFKTFREMPWGELYIQPFTGRVLTRAAFTFGTRIASFRKAAGTLNALPLSHGDAGYEFAFLDNYRLRMLVWEGDEEFPPNAQLLYTENFVDGFSAEDRVVAGDILIGILKSKM